MDAPEFLRQAVELAQQLVTINRDEPFKTGAKLVSMGGTLLTVGTTLATKTYPWLRAKIEGRSLSNKLGTRLFTAASIERSIRYYVPPYCQSIDPAGGEESRLILSVQAKLFDTLDKALDLSSEERYHILLADSGMGKTSALINYFARHHRRWRKKYDLAIVPLGIPNADERIKEIKDRHRTVLLLDALDEDTLASKSHVERIRSLLDGTSDFMRVLITCRTQFFSKDEEIPRETGIMKVGPRAGGEPAEYVFYKIYLTPFTDDQVSAYLRKRYPVWRLKRRRQAFRIVKKIPHLSARPMLLAHVDDLVKAKQDIKYSFELYEEMVEAWIRREKGFIQDSRELRAVSEKLAVDIYLNREARGAERVSKDEIKSLAGDWGIQIQEDKLSGRSLLNRDAEGNFKFAHRSIMEYLFVHSFVSGITECVSVEWTDQMKTFLWEILEEEVRLTTKLTFYEERHFWDPVYKARFLELLGQVIRHRLDTESIEWGSRTSTQTRTLVALCALYVRLLSGYTVRVSLLKLGKTIYFASPVSTIGEGVCVSAYNDAVFLRPDPSLTVYVPRIPLVASGIPYTPLLAAVAGHTPGELIMQQYEEALGITGSLGRVVLCPVPGEKNAVITVEAQEPVLNEAHASLLASLLANKGTGGAP